MWGTYIRGGGRIFGAIIAFQVNGIKDTISAYLWTFCDNTN